MKKTLVAFILALSAIGGASAKDLVVYFSVTDNTTRLAQAIHAQVGGDIVRIEPVDPYPMTDYHSDEIKDRAQDEKTNNARPAFKDLNINIADYDTIYVGYPIWWYTLPMVMNTFFDKYDFSGKTIAPFNTHAGSGSGGTYETIKQWEPNATVLEGLPVSGTSTTSDLTGTVKSWLQRIGK